MSTASSIAARRVYGVRRVCKAWGVPRSSFYAGKPADQVNETAAGKRGPKAPLEDTALLTLIREDLAATPFKGEGHRKVFGRLRYVAGHKVGRNRILRLMRKHQMLSPHRSRPAPAKAHDGRIVTDAPNVRWATDGAKIWTSEEGWLWMFTTVEHWNGELLGHHVCKRGDRFAALPTLTTKASVNVCAAELRSRVAPDFTLMPPTANVDANCIAKVPSLTVIPPVKSLIPCMVTVPCPVFMMPPGPRRAARNSNESPISAEMVTLSLMLLPRRTRWA